jgi:hypothetical protein
MYISGSYCTSVSSSYTFYTHVIKYFLLIYGKTKYLCPLKICQSSNIWEQHWEINIAYRKSSLKSGNACYRSIQCLLSSSLQSRNVKVQIYKTIILPVLLCRCKTWSLTLTEGHRLGVFVNRVLRRTFGPKRDEVTGEWRKLHIEKLHNLYSSPDIIRQIKSRSMRWAGNMARMVEKSKV